MRGLTWRLLVGLPAGMVVAALLLVSVRQAHACTCAPAGEAHWRSADYVVVGTVAGWEPYDDEPVRHGLQPLQLTLSVDSVFKGDALNPLTFVEARSYQAEPGRGGGRWAGDGGQCGLFSRDPTGVRALYALYEQADGTLAAGGCSGSVVGSRFDPPGQAQGLDRAIELAEAALGPARLPSQADIESNSGGVPMPLVVAAASAAALAVVAGGAILIRRMRRGGAQPQ